MSNAKNGLPKDVEPGSPYIQKLTEFFNKQGLSGPQLARAVFAAALRQKRKDTPTLPQAAAQRPDIDTITPVLT